MAKGKKTQANAVSKLTVRAQVDRALEFSAPAPGRPKVFWTRGVSPEMVREHWPSDDKVPYVESQLPAHISIEFPGALTGKLKRYTLGTTRKLVIYKQSHPETRLVLVLGETDDHDGQAVQPILTTRVERDRGIDLKASRSIENSLWDEACKVERRGRPRGTGHPKRPNDPYPLRPKEIKRLRKAGLDDRDLRILFQRSCENKKTFRQIGKELHITTQAVWKRWQKKIVPALKKINRKFSAGSF
jgi:hypothetical protein